MKRFVLPLMGLAMMAGVASAQTYSSTPPSSSSNTPPSSSEKATPPKSRSNRMKAEVVSTDVQARTITLKTDSGEKTMKVEGRAVRSLKKLKAGEEVWVTSRDFRGSAAVVSLRPVKMHTASGSKSHHHKASVNY